MKVIGRKIYIYWGDRVLAIEQILKDPKEFGFDVDKLTPLSNTVTQGGVMVSNIFEMGGEIVEGKRELSAYHPCLGSEIGAFLTCNACWATEKEWEEREKKLMNSGEICEGDENDNG